MKLIRKIVSTLAVAGLVFVFASCGGSKADKIVSELNNATEKVNEMKSTDDLKDFEKDFKGTVKELQKMSRENEDDFTEEEKQKIEEAYSAYSEACTNKAIELLKGEIGEED